MVERRQLLSTMVNDVRHKIEDLSLDEVNIIALAIDYFLCNYDHTPEAAQVIEDLFMHLDFTADEAEEAEDDNRLVERTDNLLVVDFRPKSD